MTWACSAAAQPARWRASQCAAPACYTWGHVACPAGPCAQGGVTGCVYLWCDGCVGGGQGCPLLLPDPGCACGWGCCSKPCLSPGVAWLDSRVASRGRCSLRCRWYVLLVCVLLLLWEGAGFACRTRGDPCHHWMCQWYPPQQLWIGRAAAACGCCGATSLKGKGGRRGLSSKASNGGQGHVMTGVAAGGGGSLFLPHVPPPCCLNHRHAPR